LRQKVLDEELEASARAPADLEAAAAVRNAWQMRRAAEVANVPGVDVCACCLCPLQLDARGGGTAAAVDEEEARGDVALPTCQHLVCQLCWAELAAAGPPNLPENAACPVCDTLVVQGAPGADSEIPAQRHDRKRPRDDDDDDDDSDTGDEEDEVQQEEEATDESDNEDKETVLGARRPRRRQRTTRRAAAAAAAGVTRAEALAEAFVRRAATRHQLVAKVHEDGAALQNDVRTAVQAIRDQLATYEDQLLHACTHFTNAQVRALDTAAAADEHRWRVLDGTLALTRRAIAKPRTDGRLPALLRQLERWEDTTPLERAGDIATLWQTATVRLDHSAVGALLNGAAATLVVHARPH
jgi:hypothetical protein